MIVHLITGLRNDMAQLIATRLDAGSASCKIKFYDGAMPAALGAISTQILLGTLRGSDPVGSVDSGTLTFGAVTQDDAADASGNATWARLTDSDDGSVIDVDVTNTLGNGAIKLNTTVIQEGGPIRLNSIVITIGGA